MLPFFFWHYDNLVDKYFVFDNGSTDASLSLLRDHGRVEIAHFDVPGDSFVDEERRLGDTIWQTSDADWVIITDIDEHIYHPQLPDYLRRCAEHGITAIQSVGYEMVSDTFPVGRYRLADVITQGVRSIGHDRLCIFNPKAVTETRFGVGRHEADPAGRVVFPPIREVLLLHYKQLGVDYMITRSAELRQGLRSRDLKESWGFHYTWSPEEIAAKWKELRDCSCCVPGLGPLKYIDPVNYFEDDRIVAESGLFDDRWYLTAYPDVEASGTNAFVHYCAHGWKEGRQPNFYFHPEWYCAHNDVQTLNRNPLCHYLEQGEKEDAWPSPCFDPGWYRLQHGLDVSASPLRHYLRRRETGLVSPLPDFDVREYCRNHPDVLKRGNDPFEDYQKRLENPSPETDMKATAIEREGTNAPY